MFRPTARLPVASPELVDVLDLAEVCRLLNRQGAAEDEASVHTRAAVRVAELGIDGDHVVQSGTEVGKIDPGKLELDVHADRRATGRDLDSRLRDRIQVTGTKAEAGAHGSTHPSGFCARATSCP